MQSLVSLTFDDGFRCQFEKALPILNSLDMTATFFLIANRDSTHDRWSGHTNDWWKIDWREDDIAMLKTLTLDGHEIGSHSVTHHPVKMRSQPEIEVQESKRLIERWMGTAISSFCYPFYRSHGYLADVVKNVGYEQARGGGFPPYYLPQASYYPVPDDGSLDTFNVDCRQVSSNENIGEWVQPRRWHIVTFHGIGGERDGWASISVDRFATQMAELAKLRDSGAVEGVTFKDGAARLRHVR
jgi:peptidoglycan/xylan/chitin deacetylase (PgdA/CDA1 family)